jgi:hypothetical protein
MVAVGREICENAQLYQTHPESQRSSTIFHLERPAEGTRILETASPGDLVDRRGSIFQLSLGNPGLQGEINKKSGAK